MWVLIEQSVLVSGIVHVFMGFVVRDWSCAAEFTQRHKGRDLHRSLGIPGLTDQRDISLCHWFTIVGRAHWGIDDYRPVNYLSDFTEN